jgi:hypothetical protein
MVMDTVTVQSPTNGTDESAGLVVSPWQTFASGPGRVEDASASIRQMWASQGSVVTHTVFTELPGVKPGYRVVTSEGLTLLVEGVEINRGFMHIPTYYTLVCRRVAS